MFTTPERMLTALDSARRWLRELAPQAWAWQMRNGQQFYVPSRWANLPVEEQARRLAEAEDQRLADATCWYLDTACVAAAMHEAKRVLRQGYRLRREDLPSRSGFMVWAEPISPESYNGVVVAMHWRVEDDGVWAAWWTDTEASMPIIAAAHGVTVSEMRVALAEWGELLYDRERLFPLGSAPALQAPPDVEQEPAVMGITAITLASWRLLSEGHVTLQNVQGVVRAASLPPETTPTSVWETGT